MLSARRGLPIGTGNAHVAALVETFEEEILDHGCGAAIILDAVVADPGCVLARAYAAALHMFGGTTDGVARAGTLLAAARGGGLPRERLMLAAVRAWHSGDEDGAVRLLGELLALAPRDLFAAKLRGMLQLSIGDASGLLATAHAALPGNRDDARAWGLLAFALDQTGDGRRAERVAHAALDRGPDPWAHHALAHAFESAGRHGEGAAWMDRHASAWEGCSSFMYTHNWWHAALLRLGAGDEDGAGRLLHARVWARRKEHGQDQINAISLGARLERRGVALTAFWAEASAVVRPRCAQVVDPFHAMHAAYALGRAGQAGDVADIVAAVAERAANGNDRWRIAADAVAGFGLYALGDMDAAAARLRPLTRELQRLGGSSVQRALWSELAAEAIQGGGARASGCGSARAAA